MKNNGWQSLEPLNVYKDIDLFQFFIAPKNITDSFIERGITHNIIDHIFIYRVVEFDIARVIIDDRHIYQFRKLKIHKSDPELCDIIKNTMQQINKIIDLCY